MIERQNFLENVSKSHDRKDEIMNNNLYIIGRFLIKKYVILLKIFHVTV